MHANRLFMIVSWSAKLGAFSPVAPATCLKIDFRQAQYAPASRLGTRMGYANFLINTTKLHATENRAWAYWRDCSIEVGGVATTQICQNDSKTSSTLLCKTRIHRVPCVVSCGLLPHLPVSTSQADWKWVGTCQQQRNPFWVWMSVVYIYIYIYI